jgi:diketogulonate reductase-like aldo/keto reductase
MESNKNLKKLSWQVLFCLSHHFVDTSGGQAGSYHDLVFDSCGIQELLLVLSQMAEKHNVSISNVAVHDIAHKPAVAAVIIGARLSIAEHITSNQATFSFPGLDQGDVALIHAVVEKGDGIAGDCGDEIRWPPKTGSKFAMLLVDEGKPRFQPTKPQGIAKLERREGKE